MTMRRAKIVCTLGPAVESPEKVRELIAAGMNMARLNLSHGGNEEHQSRLDAVRAVAKNANKAVAILVDLQGPKIRLGRFAKLSKTYSATSFALQYGSAGLGIPEPIKVVTPLTG